MNRRPTILFLNRFYWPDTAATGQMLTDLAEDLVIHGWNVSVVCGRSGYASDPGLLPKREVRNGVRIVRVSTTNLGNMPGAGRLAAYLTYLVGAFVRLLRVRRPDVVVSMSDPPFLLAPVLLAGAIRGFKTVYWVQDLYPNLAARLDLLPEDGIVYRGLRAFARLLHRRCSAVVTLGPQMAHVLVQEAARPQRTVYVHNWADAEAIRPIPPAENPFVQDHDLAGKFVVLYSGTAGRGHVFSAVVEAMRRLRSDPDILFLFVGGGRRFHEIRRIAEAEGLQNIRFLGYQPREHLRFSLSAATVSLVTEDPQVTGLIVPSKTYGIMASARPVLFVGSELSDVSRVIRETGSGIVVSPDDADGLVEAIVQMRNHPIDVEQMGQRGRDAAETVYDRRHAVRRWADLLRQLVPRAHAAVTPGREPGRPAREQTARSVLPSVHS